MSTTIILDLSKPGDTEEEIKVTNTLEDLVNGSIEPSSAAEIIDRTIVDSCRVDYISYTAVPNPTAEQVRDGTVRAPQPAGWQEYLWRCIGKAAMRVPTDNAGQGYLVDLLQELHRLPRKRVPWLVGGGLIEKELWDLTPTNHYDYLEQWLWELHEGSFLTGNVVGDPGVADAYVNFSAFLARLLAAGVVQTTRMSALIDKSSAFATSGPSSIAPYVDTAEAVRHHEPYVGVAAQWILHAGDVVYEMCTRRALASIGSPRWTQERWNGWKNKFEIIAMDERFGKPARDFAARAAFRMGQLERQGGGSGTGIIKRLEFIVPEEQEDEDDVAVV